MEQLDAALEAGGDVDWPVDRKPALEAVAEQAAGVLNVALSDVRAHGRRLGDRKAVMVEWYCRLSDASQRKVAQYLCYEHWGMRPFSACGVARNQPFAWRSACRRCWRVKGASTVTADAWAVCALLRRIIHIWIIETA